MSSSEPIADIEWRGHLFVGGHAVHEPGANVAGRDQKIRWTCNELRSYLIQYRSDIWLASFCGVSGTGDSAVSALLAAELRLTEHEAQVRETLDLI